MRARATLMMALDRVQGMTQAEAARLFGVTQPKISDLMRGKIHLFSLDSLMDMATTAGLAPRIELKVARVSKKAGSCHVQTV